MSNVGFRLGSQTNADAIMSAGKGAVDGSFYLTSDSHRLYIGAKNTDASAAATDYTLYPVNEGVETVASLAALSSQSWTKEEKKARAGRFYYVEKENILCIFNGDKFVQINVDTDTALRNVRYEKNASETDTDTKVNIVEAIEYGPDGSTVRGNLQVVTDDGLKCSFTPGTLQADKKTYSASVLTISGDTYSLSSTYSSDINGFTLNLSSANNSDADTSQTVKGAGGLHISKDDAGNLVLTSDDTHIDKDSLSVKNTSTGVEISVTDSSGIVTHKSTGYWSPKITYGVKNDAKTSVQFVNGEASLDVYTSAEIQQLLKELNGMEYRGTLGPTGSAAYGIELKNGTTTNAGSIYTLGSGGTHVSVDCKIGYMFVTTEKITLNNKTYAPGTIIICRSSDNTEKADGYIDSSKLEFDIIDAIADTDTQYKLQSLSGSQMGVKLHDTVHNKDEGTLIIENGVAKITKSDGNGNTTTEDAKGANVKVEQEVDSKTGVVTITIYHESVARTDESETATQTAENLEITAIKGFTSDETGHVKTVTTEKVTVSDHWTKLTKNDIGVTQYTLNESTSTPTYVGVVKSTVRTGDGWKGDAKITEISNYHTLASSSLQITQNKDYLSANDGSTTTKRDGLQIDMVWGSF